MSEPGYEEQESSLNLNDLLFILFRHKAIILICSLVGLVAAICFYLLNCHVYESQAKLLVRYVMDKSAVDALESQADKTLGAPTENLINSEVEILSSWDLAEQVVDAVTLKRFLPGATDATTKADAARSILLNLKVTPPKASNVIAISYKNEDPELARMVLEKLVTLYFEKHLDVHRSAGAFDFVTRETDQVRARLGRTEEESQRLKAKAGIITLAGSTATLDAELTRSQYAMLAAEVERAEQMARITEIEKALGGNPQKFDMPATKATRGSDEGLQRYQAMVIRLAQLRQGELDLLAKYTAENRIVKLHQAQIAQLQMQVRELEQRNPRLAVIVPFTGTNDSQQPNLTFERARLAGLNAKTEMLHEQFRTLKAQAATLLEMGPQIAELDRQKEIDEANYKYFGASLERTRIDEALDPSKIPNISVVQKPSPAMQATGKLKKVVMALVVSGIAAGVLVAMLIELVLDKTLKRPMELETRLKIPLLLSIPYVKNGLRRALVAPNNLEPAAELKLSDNFPIAPWESVHFIRTFAEAIRDRLILHFQINRLRHKPKLVAVTGCSHGAGASTLASGLAAAFSETGDGKVLLVDMNVSNGEVHPFFSGTPVCSLSEALQTGGGGAPADGNLYLAKATAGGNAAQLIPKRFYELIPRLKASDYDYIIFDMPPMNETSTTLAMAGFMDKVVMVIEAGVSNREGIRRAYAELVAAKANVSAVFNKGRNYAPKWLDA